MGAHAPGTLWRFAEGATIPPFDTFFLLNNPSDVPARVTARYLLSDGPSIIRTYDVPARSRRTIWVNDDASLLQSSWSSAPATPLG